MFPKSKKATIVRSGVRRPPWICRNVMQIVVLVFDMSSSMIGQKAKDAWAAIQDLLSELAQPSNKDGFFVSVVGFADGADVLHPLERATSLYGKIAAGSFDACGGNTNITAGLEVTESVLKRADRHPEDGLTALRPAVIVFTDGGHNEGPGPEHVAGRIRDKADLVTVAFGEGADEALMRSLATSSQHFYRCSSGRELRAFLAAVGATMTQTMTAGVDATQALTTVQQ